MRRLQVYRLRRSNFAHGFSCSSRIAGRFVRCLLAPRDGAGSGSRHVPGAAQAQARDRRSEHPVSDDHRIRIDSDGASLDAANGFAVLTGHVKVRQDARTISADCGHLRREDRQGHGQRIGGLRGPAARRQQRHRAPTMRSAARISTRPTFRSSTATAAASPRTWRCIRTAR